MNEGRAAARRSTNRACFYHVHTYLETNIQQTTDQIPAQHTCSSKSYNYTLFFSYTSIDQTSTNNKSSKHNSSSATAVRQQQQPREFFGDGWVDHTHAKQTAAYSFFSCLVLCCVVLTVSLAFAASPPPFRLPRARAPLPPDSRAATARGCLSRARTAHACPLPNIDRRKDDQLNMRAGRSGCAGGI